jgi:hypothetical protein
MPSYIDPEFHLPYYDGLSRALTIDVPLFRPRTVRSKAWLAVLLTMFETIINLHRRVQQLYQIYAQSIMGGE